MYIDQTTTFCLKFKPKKIIHNESSSKNLASKNASIIEVEYTFENNKIAKLVKKYNTKTSMDNNNKIETYNFHYNNKGYLDNIGYGSNDFGNSITEINY